MVSSVLGAEEAPKPGVFAVGPGLRLCEAMNLSRSSAMSSDRRSVDVLVRSMDVFVPASMVAVFGGRCNCGADRREFVMLA